VFTAVDEAVVKMIFPSGMTADSVDELEQSFRPFIKRRNAVPEPKSQSRFEKFRQAARELGTDGDPRRFRARLGKLVKHEPAEKPE
jgi:hypothetical protein